LFGIDDGEEKSPWCARYGASNDVYGVGMNQVSNDILVNLSDATEIV